MLFVVGGKRQEALLCADDDVSVMGKKTMARLMALDEASVRDDSSEDQFTTEN